MRFSFLTFVTVILLSFGAGVRVNAQDPALPPDVARALRQANAEHEEAMGKRFEPIIQDLSRGSDSDYAQLYSDAIHAVFFANDDEKGTGWKSWQKENKNILADPRLPAATQTSALYLQGQLYLVLGRQVDASNCFNKVLNIMASGPQDLGGFHLIQESLTSTLLFKYYNLSPEYFKAKDAYYGSIAQIEPLFKKLILPIAIQSDPKNIESYWNTAINAVGNTASLSDTAKQKFAVDDYQRLSLEEAKCLNDLGQKKKAVAILEQLLTNYPDSPRYKETSDALIAASTPAPAAPSTAVATPTPDSTPIH